MRNFANVSIIACDSSTRNVTHSKEGGGLIFVSEGLWKAMSRYISNELFYINPLKLMESDILTAPQVDVFYSPGTYEERLPELKFSCHCGLTLLWRNHFYASESQYTLPGPSVFSLSVEIAVSH